MVRLLMDSSWLDEIFNFKRVSTMTLKINKLTRYLHVNFLFYCLSITGVVP